MLHHWNEIGIVASASGALLCSQVDTSALPTEAKWLQTTVTGVCIAILVWLITKHGPAREEQHSKTIEAVTANHAAAIKEVCDHNRASVDKICAELSETRETIEAGTQAQITLLKDHVLKKP